MHALLAHDPLHEGVKFIRELFEEKPELHPAIEVRDVSATEGVAVGWAIYPDGRVGPWVPPLAEIVEQAVDALRMAARLHIVAGFTSAALGDAHTYGSNETDQANLSADALTASKAAKTWSTRIACADGDGIWERREHTAAQVARVLSDFQEMRATAQSRLDERLARARAPKALEAVSAAVW